jgi:hypothetical protein
MKAESLHDYLEKASTHASNSLERTCRQEMTNTDIEATGSATGHEPMLCMAC